MDAVRHFVTTRDGVRLMLLHFPARRRASPAVLLLHGFAQNHRAFDAPNRSFARHLQHAGFHVFVGTLRGRHASHKHAASLPHGFWHYVEEDAPALVRGMAALVPEDVPRLMVGHSMGGIITVSLPEHVGNLLCGRVAWCSPLWFLHWLGPLHGPLALWMRAVRAGLPVPLPTSVVGPGLAFGAPVLDRARPWPMAVWKPGGVEPALLKWALQKTFAPEGLRVLADLMELGRTKGAHAGKVPVMARLRTLTGPLLVAAADHDALAPPRSVRPLYEAAQAAQRRWMVFGRRHGGHSFGHLDVILGRAAPAIVWPAVTTFLAQAAHAAGLGPGAIPE